MAVAKRVRVDGSYSIAGSGSRRRRAATRVRTYRIQPAQPYVKGAPVIPPTPIKVQQGRFYAAGSTTYANQTLSGYSNLLYALGSGNNTLSAANGNDYMRVLSGIAAGDNDDNRDGNSVTLTALSVSGIIAAGSTQSGADIARMLLVYDNSPSGVLPLFSDIFASVGPGVTDAVVCAPNLGNRSRFSVLLDQRYTIDPSDSSRMRQIKLYKRLNLPCIYKSGAAGAGAGIGNMSQGVLYMFLLGGNTGVSASSTAVPYMKCEAKLYYKE